MKTKKRKNKKEKIIYNPMKITGALKELGESYSRKEAVLYYIAILLIALVLGFFFELQPFFLCVVVAAYILFVPQLMYNQKKRAYELRRFNDVNAYMSQMAQSFTSTKQVVKSLRETGETFPVGRMHDAIMDAIESIENDFNDVREAEEKALAEIEKKYNCEKIRNLHDFLMMAEERGGECAAEFGILENVRTVWEKAVSDYHRKLVFDRNVGTVLYIVMLFICSFVMKAFPDTLSIIGLTGVQVVNMLMLILFIIFFVFMDIRLNSSLLKDAKTMSKETSDAYFTYMQTYDSAVERKKYIAIPILMAVLVVLLFITNPSPMVLAIGIVLVAVAFNVHKIILMVTVWILKNEITKAFPKWLFDIMLIMQRESVEGAIFKSLEKAPPVLKNELTRISRILEYEPKNADAYMSFLADFNILGIETTMRKLYSLSVGTGGDVDVMKVIIDSNMTLLIEAEKRNIAQRGDMSALYNFVPLFIVTMGMIAYCVALVMLSLAQVWTLFE